MCGEAVTRVMSICYDTGKFAVNVRVHQCSSSYLNLVIQQDRDIDKDVTNRISCAWLKQRMVSGKTNHAGLDSTNCDILPSSEKFILRHCYCVNI